jgi:hypothetical protein
MSLAPSSLSPYSGFVFLDQQAFQLTVEQRTLRVQCRRAYAALPEEILILSYLDYFGGQASVVELGSALGFALADNFAVSPPLYRDEAEAAVWDELLSQLHTFGLIQIQEGQIHRTLYASVVLDRKIKYQYLTADCKIWQFSELVATADFPFYDLSKVAQLTDERPAPHPGNGEVQENKCPPVNHTSSSSRNTELHLLTQARTQLAASEQWADVEIISLVTSGSKGGYPITDNVLVTGHCYRFSSAPADQDAPDYRITAAINDVANQALTTAINEPANANLRRRWGHACEFEHFRADPTAVINLTALRRFAVDWPYVQLLADARLTWSEPGVLKELRDYAPTHHSRGSYRDYCEHLSAHIPLPLLEASLDTYPSLWSWSQLSQRLSDDFIATHLVQRLDHASELRYPWDFEVLSRRSISAIEGWLSQLLRSDWAEHLLDSEAFDWDWAALTIRLSESFVLANLAVLPFSRSILLERGLSFVRAALQNEIDAGKIGSWQWDELHDTLDLQFIWDHLAQLQQHVKWKRVLAQLLSPNVQLPAGFDYARLLQLVQLNREYIHPFASEKLAWTPSLIQFFDDNELLHWSSNSYSAGFEVHPDVPWTADHFARYHSRVRTAAGRTYVSAHITDLTLVAQHPDFKWDWAELSGNSHFNWTRALTTTYRDRIVWSRLLQRFGPEEVAHRLPDLHAQLAASQPESLTDLWRYANAQLAVPTLLAWRTDYTGFLDLGLLCRRDALTVATDLLAIPDFDQPWDWVALATALPAESIINLLRKLEGWYRQNNDERVTAFSRLAAPRLPLDFSLRYASILTLPWDWAYVSRQLTPEQLHEHLAHVAAKVDWDYLVQQPLMQPLLTSVWLLDPRAQSFLPWQLVSQLVSPEQVTTHLEALASFLNWDYLARQPAMRSLVVSQLLDHPVVKQILPWEYVLSNCFTQAELAINLPEWTSRFNSLHSTDVRTGAWRAFTRQLPVEAILPAQDQTLYPTISFPELRTMQLDWEFLSADSRLAHRLTLDLLRRYRSFWHWPTLSRNRHLNSDHDYLLDPNLRTHWDWEWISEHSKFIGPVEEFEKLERRLNKFASYIHWSTFSRRLNLPFSGKLLTLFATKDWDWEALSHSPKLALDSAALLKLQNKPWNWAALSVNPGLGIDLAALAQLTNYPWDWEALSDNSSLRFDNALVLLGLCNCSQGLASQPWNWSTLTRRADFGWNDELLRRLAHHDLDWQFICTKMPVKTVKWSDELLFDLRDRLDWVALSQHPPIPLSPKLLRMLAAYWDFAALSRCAALTEPHSFPKLGLETAPRTLLLAQTDELPWDWHYLSARTDIQFSEAVFDQLIKHLHWPALSRRPWGQQFGPDWVARYRPYWDLVALAIHGQLPKPVQDKVLAAIEADPTGILSYLYRLQRHSSAWAGYAFHCTHLTNAAAIIQSGQLLSRREVLKTKHKLADASGSINHRPSEVWDYARLYYRPQTFTQFYTERLGLDKTSFFDTKRRYLYNRAENLGFPKCPIPVYFRFRLDEILHKSADRFYISDGNMQKGSTTHDRLRPMLRRFYSDKLLYYRQGAGSRLNDEDWSRYKEVAQQEILLKPGLDLASVDTIDIFVQDSWASQELRRLIGADHPLASRIQVDYHGHCFHNENKPVTCDYSDNELTVETSFADDHDLVFTCNNMSKIAEIHIPNGAYRIKGNQLISQGRLHLSLHEPIAFTVSFRDKVTSRPDGPREYELLRMS